MSQDETEFETFSVFKSAKVLGEKRGKENSLPRLRYVGKSRRPYVCPVASTLKLIISMEPCYQSIKRKPDLIPVEETCLPLSLSHTIRLPLLLHTRHTIVHLYTMYPSREKEIRLYHPFIILYSPCPVNRARQSDRLCTTRIPRFRSTHVPPPLQRFL